jgi:Predicted ATPase (AAA+ superfamily)
VKGSYLKRIVDEQLAEYLSASGAVLIEGVKWCGKTSTAKEKAASILLMQDPKKVKQNIALANTDPDILLEGSTPRLIDEWQLAPAIWDAVRNTVDERRMPGQFILTGSSLPADDPTRHSGTGRIFRMMMRPMSLYESGESNGSVSLGDLFKGSAKVRGVFDRSIREIGAALIRGGWPGSIGVNEKVAILNAQMYVEAIINTDISVVDGVSRNPTAVRELLRSLSRNISTQSTMSTIRNDMLGDDDRISDKTVSSYINALRRIFVVEDLPAWNPSLRSKTAVRESPKRHFADPSIAAAVMRLSADGLMEDFKTFGLLFESMCIRDLRVYSQAIDGEVFHYRDKNNLEADAVIHLRDGRWCAAEIKLGSDSIDDGAKNLLKLKNKIDLGKMKEPSFLMVITSSGYAYKRDDGVFVVPIGCLKN